MVHAQDTSQPTGWQRFWRFPITRIAAYLFVMIALAVAASFPLRGLLRLFHLHTKGHAEIGEMIGELLLALCAVGAMLFMVGVVEKRTLASTGFSIRGLGKETGLGLLIGGGLFSLVVGLTAAFGGYHVFGWNVHFAWLLPVIIFLGTAVFEETVFRGYLFQTLESRWGSGIALAGSGAAFGLIHLLNPIHGITPVEKLAGPVFIVFEASILMTAGYLLTRRLWLPIGIHWGWNFFENSVFGATDSGEPANPVYTLAHAHFTGPFALTGGPFGPEAGVICFVVGTAAGLLLLRLAVQRGQWLPRPTFSHPTVTLNQEAVP